jgi:hypothetical protein
MKAWSAIEALDGFDDCAAAPTTHGRHVSIPTRFASMLHQLCRGLVHVRAFCKELDEW